MASHKSPTSGESPILNVLKRAMVGAWDDDTAPRHAVQSPNTPSVPMPQPWPNYGHYQAPPAPVAAPLKDVPAHLTDLRELFRENSDLRRSVDTAIDKEFDARERPLNRQRLLSAAICVVVGLAVGFVLALALHVGH
jgi:hypothetical protein